MITMVITRRIGRLCTCIQLVSLARLFVYLSCESMLCRIPIILSDTPACTRNININRTSGYGFNKYSIGFLKESEEIRYGVRHT